jgi:hypothetical protein
LPVDGLVQAVTVVQWRRQGHRQQTPGARTGVGINNLFHIVLVATTAIGEDQAATAGRWENVWMSASSMESGIFE